MPEAESGLRYSALDLIREYSLFDRAGAGSGSGNGTTIHIVHVIYGMGAIRIQTCGSINE
jgi:hypothetical protein